MQGLPNAHIYKGIPTEKDIVSDLTQSYVFIKMPDNTFVVTNDYSNTSLFCQSAYCDSVTSFVTGINKTTGIKIDTELTLDKLGSTSQYTDTDTGIKFTIHPTTDLFDKAGFYLLKDLDNNTQLFSNQDQHSDTIRLKTVINPVLVIKLPTGLAATVETYMLNSYSNSFVYQKGTAVDGYNPYLDGEQIKWIAQEPPKQLPKDPFDKGIMTDYTGVTYTTDYNGCRGNLTIENSSSDSEALDTQNNLVRVANTDKGSTIYDIKNKEFKIFQQFWFWKIISNGLDNLSYNDYLALKPILIQKDQLGIYRMIFRAELVASKCWGEPLIYLYPQQKASIQVKLSNVIDLTESEPAYNSGWNVLAYPDGRIFDTAKQRYYPYLYWEGSAPDLSNPVIQGIVHQKDIHIFLEKQLTILGLNNKERNDFENYWEPQLKDSPYYLISFYDAQALNTVAPLIITPKPDTMIRVLMSYDRLNTKIEVPSLNTYQTPQRKGFTAVEWGGILHK